MPAAEALAKLQTTARGLTTEEAERRLEQYGPNELSHSKTLGFWADIFHRCRSPLVIQLLIIAAVSGVIGRARSPPSIVGAMILLSVGLSYVLDRRSGRAVEKLGKRVQSRTVVAQGRQGGRDPDLGDRPRRHRASWPAGSIIPADLRLLSAKDFFVSQSALTGESMPVEKTADASAAAGPARRSN